MGIGCPKVTYHRKVREEVLLMKVSAVHMCTKLADVTSNLQLAEKYIIKAIAENVELIAFPEFFTTGFAVNPKLIEAIISTESPLEQMKKWAKQYNIIIGGSYLWYDRVAENVYNTYSLVFPTGEEYHHNKDIPTALENYCYTNGDTISAFETPIGRIGIAMCWEQIRYDTINRMYGKVDLVLAGSCWWNFCEADGSEIYRQLWKVNHQLALEAPITFAKLLGVPVVHGSHKATFKSGSINDFEIIGEREIVGATQIIDKKGNVIKSKMYNETDGIIAAEIEVEKVEVERKTIENQYWIPKLPSALLRGFEMLNVKCKEYYYNVSLPMIKEQPSQRKQR
jgi:predicted amidohydrolase